MARLTAKQREQARNDYEVHGMGIREVARKWGVSHSTVGEWAKKENWVEGKTDQIVEKKKNAIKELIETDHQIDQLTVHQQMAVKYEVESRLEAEKIYIDAARYNQILANQVLSNIDTDELKLTDLNQHSQITQRNKDIDVGKSPDTAVQVNTAPQEIKVVIVDNVND